MAAPRSFNDSQLSLPTTVRLGLVDAPARAPPLRTARSWNRNTQMGMPHTQHTPQRFTRPAVDAAKMTATLTSHTNCSGTAGIVHGTLSSIARANANTYATMGVGCPILGDKCIYVAGEMISSVRRRAFVAAEAAKEALAGAELEKRFWLSGVLDEKAARFAARHHESRDAHAALRARGVPYEDGRAQREKLATLRAAAAMRTWKAVPVSPIVGPPPYALPVAPSGSPARRATILTPREGGEGAVVVVSPRAAAAVLGTARS